jgi:hypothetical protein
MPQIRQPVVLDLATPLTRRRRRVRITALLVVAGLVASLTLLLSPARRTVTTSNDNIVPGDILLTDIMPTLSVGAAIVAEPSIATALPIYVVPADSVPAEAWIRISSVPLLSSLSEGYEIAPGLWGVPLAALPNLKITAPSGPSIRSVVSVALMSADGKVLAEALSVLAVMSARQLLTLADVTVAEPDGIEVIERSAPRPRGAPQCRNEMPTASFSYEQAQAARRLVEKGDSALSEGQVAVARSFYQRGAQMGWSGAAFALATTYDPYELIRWPLGPSANLTMARCWYARAEQLAEAEAAYYLKRLEPMRNLDKAGATDRFPFAGTKPP